MLLLGLNGCLSPVTDDFMPERWPLYYHDAAAVLIRDGQVVAGIEQERLNRIKHTTRFPGAAIRFCLDAAGAALPDLDRIAFFFDEQYTDRELYQHYAQHPRLPVRSSRELLADRLREHFDADLPPETFEFVPHHTAHACTAYPQSGYPDALVVVMDGGGGDTALSVHSARGPALDLLASKEIAGSLGYLYLAGTQLLGYGLGDEYKVMGLAPHGDPRTYRPVFDSLYDLLDGGGFRMDHADLQPAFAEAGFPLRRQGEPFHQEHKDFAAGLQEMLGNIGWHVISHWQRATGHRRLALAGGVGQNCTFNGTLLRSGIFDDVFVHPAAHDAGAALGAALKVHTDLGGRLAPRRTRSVFWGPPLPDRDEVARLLGRWQGFVTVRHSARVERDTAALLAQDKVVGWVQGCSEFGPRALGNRSILADPRPEANRDRVNRMVKQRETYRPFAPSIRAENLREYFEFPAGMAPPDFMVFTVPVRAERRDRLGAVTHVDGTARVHAVDREVNPRFWRLLTEFAELTGVPVLLNTSFNNHAEPIVDSVDDALRCFLTTRIDHLVIGELLVSKLSWTLVELAELRPALTPSVRLRTERAPGGQARHTVVFGYLGGKEQEISDTVHAVLTRADGHRSLRELGATDEPVLATVQHLWCERYLSLTPA
jgi:predicted NodU family carbamoyl transferase